MDVSFLSTFSLFIHPPLKIKLIRTFLLLRFESLSLSPMNVLSFLPIHYYCVHKHIQRERDSSYSSDGHGSHNSGVPFIFPISAKPLVKLLAQNDPMNYFGGIYFSFRGGGRRWSSRTCQPIRKSHVEILLVTLECVQRVSSSERPRNVGFPRCYEYFFKKCLCT